MFRITWRNLGIVTDLKTQLEQAVQEERCTALHGVPTMFIAELELEDFESYDFSSLRTGIMAGAPCPVEVMKQVIEPGQPHDRL